jgi:putative restriction endonuclease
LGGQVKEGGFARPSNNGCIRRREAVITACRLSGPPEPLLLDAAHIVADKDEHLGQPIVPNGIPLSKIHHAAFDAHLIGIDPDYRLHVSGRLLALNDGPMLEVLKRLNGEPIHLPARVKDRPDRDRLALRFKHFKASLDCLQSGCRPQ